jgi:hypothetical protein
LNAQHAPKLSKIHRFGALSTLNMRQNYQKFIDLAHFQPPTYAKTIKNSSIWRMFIPKTEYIN